MQEVELYNSSGEELYQLAQWDKDVYITVKAQTTVFTGTGSCQVHFFSGGTEEALVVNSTYTVTGGTLSVTCKIPNLILTKPYAVNGHIVMYYDTGTETEEIRGTYKFRINILNRPKPSDYIYVESDDYVALSWVMEKCENYALDASNSSLIATSARDAASTYASNSLVSEQAAKNSENAAKASETASASHSAAAATSATNAATYEHNALNSKNAAALSESNALTYKNNAADSASAASTSASGASTSATNAASSATLAESYAKGGTGSRSGENTDNAKYYSEQAYQSAQTAGEAVAEVIEANIEETLEEIREKAAAAADSADAAEASASAASASEAKALSYKVSAGNSASAAAQSLISANNAVTVAQEYAESAQKSAEDAAAAAGSNLYSIGLNPVTGRLSLFYNGEEV